MQKNKFLNTSLKSDLIEWIDKSVATYDTDWNFLRSMYDMMKPDIGDKNRPTAEWSLVKFHEHLDNAQASLRNFRKALDAN